MCCNMCTNRQHMAGMICHAPQHCHPQNWGAISAHGGMQSGARHALLVRRAVGTSVLSCVHAAEDPTEHHPAVCMQVPVPMEQPACCISGARQCAAATCQGPPPCTGSDNGVKQGGCWRPCSCCGGGCSRQPVGGVGCCHGLLPYKVRRKEGSMRSCERRYLMVNCIYDLNALW